MDRSAGAVAVKLRHVERLSDHTLARERGVSVDQQRQNFPARFSVSAHPLPRAHGSFDDRIDRLEMARVCREADFDFGAVLQFADRAIAEVIFHVAVAGHEVGNVVRRKFGEDDLERFLEEICQDIEPAAMGHAHANFFDAMLRAALQNAVENYNERFRALKRKPLLADITRVEKCLERLGLQKRAQNRDLALA